MFKTKKTEGDLLTGSEAFGFLEDPLVLLLVSTERQQRRDTIQSR